MPRLGELPQTIQKLAERNAIDLVTRRSTNLFKAGMDEIINLIEKRVPELRPAPPMTLQPFEFEVVTLQIQAGLFGGKQVNRQSQKKTAQQHIEDLGNGVYCEMVSIPGGSFIMGAPASEESSEENERPQHRVTVQPFLMGKYAVTQKLWQTVAGFPTVEHDLELNPSRFKGDQRPVEQMSWFDAVEFCQRLSSETGRNYRLPSEAEWEYACRAGTTTPFHFGETVTVEWLNCIGSLDGDAPKSGYRQRTTDVGSFPANAFGLFDMHGNVWEWCADHWHDNYTNAPIDGSAWVTGGNFELRVRRGGSWFSLPWSCRSASRVFLSPDLCNPYIGFRVVCSAPRTL
ncbi:formylglycine-generating enzyme family protein [Oscillatoria sp. FACHB-1407]|nr:formylglycine-generating enzyme family protein [Oscillatoria sp. FACHB-1407]